jgi:hypothetical protein
MKIVYSVVNAIVTIDVSIQLESDFGGEKTSVRQRRVVSNQVQKDIGKFAASITIIIAQGMQ